MTTVCEFIHHDRTESKLAWWQSNGWYTMYIHK